jgi:ABC-type Zn uptake system ZnuABC Zn-binding protein ZnuA
MSAAGRGVRPVALAIVLLGALLLAACGGEGSADGRAELNVAATTAIAADIVRRVGGEVVEVVQLVPDGSSPHSYAPSAREQAELAESDLLVLFSPNLEQALPLDSASRSFAIAEQSGEESGDPHVWLDPTLVADAVPALADELAGLDPANAAGYRMRAEAYAAQLDRLDTELERIVDRIPSADRKLVTSHDSIGHFADRYGFEFVGAPFGLAPEAEASAGELADLIDAIEAEGVPAVFAQRGDNPEVLRGVAEEAGVEVVDDLLLEGFGEGVDSYVEMMRASATRITEALGGAGGG